MLPWRDGIVSALGSFATVSSVICTWIGWYSFSTTVTVGSAPYGTISLWDLSVCQNDVVLQFQDSPTYSGKTCLSYWLVDSPSAVTYPIVAGNTAAAFVVFASVAGFVATANVAAGPSRLVKWAIYPTALYFAAAIAQAIAWGVYVGYVQASYSPSSFSSGEALLGGATVNAFSPSAGFALSIVAMVGFACSGIAAATLRHGRLLNRTAAVTGPTAVSTEASAAEAAVHWPMPRSRVVIVLGWTAWVCAVISSWVVWFRVDGPGYPTFPFSGFYMFSSIHAVIPTASSAGPLPANYPSKYEISTPYAQLPFEELKWSFPRAASAVSATFVFVALCLICAAQTLVQCVRNGFAVPAPLRHPLLPASAHFLAAASLVVAWGAFVGLYQAYYAETLLGSGGETTSGTYSVGLALAVGATGLELAAGVGAALCQDELAERPAGAKPPPPQLRVEV